MLCVDAHASAQDNYLPLFLKKKEQLFLNRAKKEALKDVTEGDALISQLRKFTLTKLEGFQKLNLILMAQFQMDIRHNGPNMLLRLEVANNPKNEQQLEHLKLCRLISGDSQHNLLRTLAKHLENERILRVALKLRLADTLPCWGVRWDASQWYI